MTSFQLKRDRWGIAHVTAPDRAAAFRAQGYCAADDRMWQMEFDRLKAAGRWSEVVGESGVREDTIFRRIGIEAAARRDWDGLSAGAKAMTTEYATGVNRWLAEHGDQLPREFDHHPFAPVPWEPWHCNAVYKVRHVFMGTLMRKLWRGAVARSAGPELARRMRGEPGAASAIVPPDGPAIDLLEGAAEALAASADIIAGIPEVDGASNSWAIHGSRTASGKPLLAGDPHRGIEFPNVYLQFHMACDEFDVIGLSFPGVPGFAHFGHNADVAWCITHAMADDTDVYVEQAGDVTKRRREIITVRDSEPVEITCGTSPRGPFILGDLDTGPVLCTNWTGLTPDTTLDCLLPMLLAGTCGELEEAVRAWVIPANSLLTADTAGDISYKVRGRIIERPTANRWAPVPGDDAHSWTGLEPVPFDDLQQWRNPERGFLVTANNRLSDHGPYISLDFAPSSRHDRIVELLDGVSEATVADMTAIHGDVRSLFAPPVCRIIADLQPTTELGVGARDMVAQWDHRSTADSTGSVVYATFRQAWAREVDRRIGARTGDLGEAGWPRALDASRMLLDASTNLLLTGGWEHVPGIETDAQRATVLAGLLDQVAADLAEAMGDDPTQWRWADQHIMLSPHPLAAARPEAAALALPVTGVPGDGETVRAGGVATMYGLRSYLSSVARYVFDVADWDNSGWIVPHGVSGVRGSGHDLDQRDAWLACELIPMAYSTDSVDEHSRTDHTIEL